MEKLWLVSQEDSEIEIFKEEREHLLGKNAREPEGDLTKIKQTKAQVFKESKLCKKYQGYQA